MSSATAVTAGVLLLSAIGISYGGTFLLRVVTGRFGANDLQRRFFRAGHAHAGVLVILGLVVQLYLDVARADTVWSLLGAGVLVAAIVMPAGFFLSVLGRDPAKPSRLIALLWLGAGCLVVGLLGAAIGLIGAGLRG